MIKTIVFFYMNSTWQHFRHQLQTRAIHQNPAYPPTLLCRRLHSLYFNLFHFSPFVFQTIFFSLIKKKKEIRVFFKILKNMEKIRRPSHAGSWYTDNPKKLEEELEGWLSATGLTKSPDVRGVIAPHAGYSYSGRAAAYAFGNIDPTNITRVFLLGPSHHHYTPKCALSTATVYETPIGDLPIDLEVIEELKATGKFELMDLQVDEAEHSMEMHLPYLAKIFEGHPVKVVPILVGSLHTNNEAMYGRLLAKYVDDPTNFFSVSSDFCHWGSRFQYTHYDKKCGPIHKSIEALDRMGMDIIETGNADAFKQYLSEYDNTICGRHPISVFLHMSRNCSTKIKIKFLRYEQSTQCKTMRDSSVSYASAAAKVDA
ncbi:hypothetical protein OIU84_000184 [Salix udensis]|uniref:Protein MEMO1 n=1 Tax=Salix udensis TaxID=889485 RepID=A0AAD6PMV8_9ROSI|nr:hypothetical protein OIU84_000184 [Salix udensis]